MKKRPILLSPFSIASIAYVLCFITPSIMAQLNSHAHLYTHVVVINDQVEHLVDDANATFPANNPNSMSTLAIIMICIAALLIVGVLVWYFVIRERRYPTFKIDYFTVTRPYRSKKSIRGAYRVVCSASPIKQSTWERISKGKMVNEVNNNWTTPVIFEPHIEGEEHGAKHHGNKHYIATSSVHKKEQPSTLTNKVTLVSIEIKLM